ncbi:gamma-glutamyltransferase [Rhodohalobacter sulfatireducens]|uniref:Glutathione hydrolase proenzyme n=1 Tax=Rhodohalobacter sulfatireducens TaxID=2911366 RepID=A0ABS9KD39_9BACT|nr:gamma-glutamyltransferase [Rhodohalobacter sulfatireducens]MCG2588753.1 gamma-glutamyltransferase [Rhodohalobacter sulfatireducens]
MSCNIIKNLLILLIISAGFVFFSLSGCVSQSQQGKVSYQIPEPPEISTGYQPKPGWATSEFAVASANPLSTDAGYQIIQAGGNAVDATIAVQLVLTLVEPQSSGIGGGAFFMMWDGKEIHAYNGRETAPSGATERLFLDENGETLQHADAVRSGKSVGVPGTLALLNVIHDEFGRLPWTEVLEPAITLAEEGFEITPRLHELLENDESLRNDELARDFYYDEEGNALPVGHLLKNPALAQILRKVSGEGISAFYEGDAARDISARIQAHEQPGSMTTEDLEEYPSLDLETEEICNDWKAYEICGFPPPASGHLAIMQILGIMENLKEPEVAFLDSIPSTGWLHQYLEAAKLAFADRNQYVADERFVQPPGGSWQTMLDSTYLAERAQLIQTNASMERAEPGTPGEMQAMYGVQKTQPEYGTSHISIVDREGNAVSMTTTIESGFGSRIMSDGGTGLPGGFMLNNELTDFSFSPIDEEGNPIANRVEPGKRPRSSMAPTLVFDGETGEFLASVGSPGGTSIIHYTAKAIVGMYEWDLNAQKAIDLPNFGNYNGPSVLEENRFPDNLINELEAMGHEIIIRPMTSGIHAIQKTDKGYFGGADPRREGTVMGE